LLASELLDLMKEKKMLGDLNVPHLVP
jgi:hypothetical protein